MNQDNLSYSEYYCAAQKIFGNRPSIGVAVIEHFEGVKNLFNLSENELKSLSKLVPECRRISREIVDTSSKELDLLKDRNISFVSYNDAAYPPFLKDINNYPIGIYIQTNQQIEGLFKSTKLLGVIGCKKPYSYGQKSCNAIIDSLLKSATKTGIITRMTSGVDQMVHNLAVSHEITSVGVLPYGFPKTPSNHGQTIEDLSTGAIITDIEPGETMNRNNLLRRNRIISALCSAIILVESGGNDPCSQIIDNAFSYGKEIWAFPGPSHWNGYIYNNKLVRLNIAEMISSYEDLKDKIQRL